MLPCPTTPRAGQSALWQNRACGSIGDPPRGWFGDQTRRDARWARVLSSHYPRITVEGSGTRHTSQHRIIAALQVDGVFADASIIVLPQTRQRFEVGFALYKARPDKAYSLTDCISMEAMRQ